MHFMLEDSDPGSSLLPFFKADLPNTRSLISSLAERRPSKSGGGWVYVWKDQQDLKYETPDTSSLIFVQLTIEFYSDDSKRRVKKNFLGDIELDLFSLFVGPATHKLELAHGDRKCTLYFESSIQQESQPSLVIDDFSVSLPSVSFSCSVPHHLEPVNVAFKGKTTLHLNPLMFADLDGFDPLVLTSSDGESMEISLMDIFLFNEQGGDCERTFLHDGEEFTVSMHLTMVNAPRFVQSRKGYHYTENGIFKYSGLDYPDGTMTLEDRPDFLFSESDLPCDPPFNPRMTLDPIELKITCMFGDAAAPLPLLLLPHRPVTDIRFRLLSVQRRYKFLYLTAHTQGFSTSSIVFRLNANDEFVLAGTSRPSLRYTTRTPYRLTREGVTFSFSTKPSNVNPMGEIQSADYAQSIAEPITEVRIPILQLLSDPDTIDLPLSGKEEGRIKLRVNSETVQKTIYLSFHNISITKLPLNARYILGVKVDDSAAIVDSGLDLETDTNSETATLKCTETPFFPLTFSSKSIETKRIVVRLMKHNGRRSLKPYKTIWKYDIPLVDLMPLQREASYQVSQRPKAAEAVSLDGSARELEQIPYPFSFSFLIYTNQDKIGYYPEFYQMREKSDDGTINTNVRKFQPGLIQHIPNGEEPPVVPDSQSVDVVRVVSSTVDLPSRDLELKKNDADDCLEFSFKGEPALTITLDTISAVSSLSYLLITNAQCRLLLYTPYASLFVDVIDKLSGHVSPYLTDVEPEISEDFQDLLKRKEDAPHESVMIARDASVLRSMKASDIGSFAATEYVTGSTSSGEAVEQVFYLPCRCERLYELTCLTCRKPLLDLSLWTLVKYQCQREVPDELDRDNKRSCGSFVFFIQPHHKDLELTSVQCKICHQNYQDGDECTIMTVFRCSCTACFEAECPFCKAVPDNLNPYYKKACKQCNQVLLVTSSGRNCPFCQTML